MCILPRINRKSIVRQLRIIRGYSGNGYNIADLEAAGAHSGAVNVFFGDQFGGIMGFDVSAVFTTKNQVLKYRRIVNKASGYRWNQL